MIPPCDKVNKCLPPGCYDCSLDEIKQTFVTQFPASKSRESRFKGYVEHSKYICENVKSTRRQLIDGSFTTSKLNPHDVDFIIIINQCDVTPEEKSFIRFEKLKQQALKRQRHIMESFVEEGFVNINELPCCDCFYIYKREHDDENYNDYVNDKKLWLEWFGHSRKNKRTGKQYPKGILNLTLNSETFEGI